jgi:hypothetical protein
VRFSQLLPAEEMSESNAHVPAVSETVYAPGEPVMEYKSHRHLS